MRTEGNRRHLCRVEEGGSIFAISGVRGRLGGGLVAVGAGPAQLLKFARGDLIRLSFEEGLSEQVAVLVDDWLLRVGRALEPSGRNRRLSGARVGDVHSLEAGVRFGVRQGVGWVRHLSGSSRFLDQVPLPESELEARFPLSENLWLTAASEGRVTACDTATMIRSSDPWAGLDEFHRTMLDYISGIEDEQSRSGWAEFRRSIEHENALVESVTSELAAVATDSAISPIDPGGDALVTACRTLGQTLGIEVRAPRTGGTEGGGPSSDPLGDLARASGFHVRPVTLPPDWWRRAGASRYWVDWPIRVVCRSLWSRPRGACDGEEPPTSFSIMKAEAGRSTSVWRRSWIRERGPSTERCRMSRSESSTCFDSA